MTIQMSNVKETTGISINPECLCVKGGPAGRLGYERDQWARIEYSEVVAMVYDDNAIRLYLDLDDSDVHEIWVSSPTLKAIQDMAEERLMMVYRNTLVNPDTIIGFAKKGVPANSYAGYQPHALINVKVGEHKLLLGVSREYQRVIKDLLEERAGSDFDAD